MYKYGLVNATVMAVALALGSCDAEAAEANDKYWSEPDVHSEGDAVWSMIEAKETDEILMYTCTTAADGQCYFMAGLNNSCTEDMNPTPILASVQGAGVWTATLNCGGKVEGDSRYAYKIVADDMNSLRNDLMGGTWVRMAMPMADGKFRALTFSLVGSDKQFRKVTQLSIDMEPAGTKQKSGYTQPVESGEF